jgi:hypothetical protein
MGLIETVSTAASNNLIDALTAQQVMENSLYLFTRLFSDLNIGSKNRVDSISYYW